MAGVGRLRRRAEFLRVAQSGRKSVMTGLILQAAARVATVPGEVGPRLGFTASRKVGIAVIRNRARRRLRAAAQALMPLHAAPGNDYVLIARAGTIERPYAALLVDLERALRQVGAYRDAAPPPTGRKEAT